MGGGGGWRSDELYDAEEARIRSLPPKDRTEVEQRFIDSCEEMRKEERLSIWAPMIIIIYALVALVITFTHIL
jgi:hypothetical protein